MKTETTKPIEQTKPKGIGEVYAANIIKGRPFLDVDSLINVKGIGEKRLELIRPFVTITD